MRRIARVSLCRPCSPSPRPSPLPAAADAAACSGADSPPAALGQPPPTTPRCACSTQQRRSHGLRALRADSKLGRAADGHARDMVAKHYFDHDSKSRRLLRHPHQAHRLDPLAPLLDRRREHRLGRRLARHPALDGPRLDEQRRPPREHPRPQLPHDRHRHRQRRPDRRRRRDLRHRLRRLSSPSRLAPFRAVADNGVSGTS